MIEEHRALVGTKRLAQRIRQSDRGAAAQRVRRDLHPETPFGSLPASPEGSTWPCSSELLETIEGRSVGESVTPAAPLVCIIRIGHRIYRTFTVRFVQWNVFSYFPRCAWSRANP